MILVTGCAGYIGSQLCHVLKKKKISFVGIDNLKYSNKKNIILKKKFYKHDISSFRTSKLIKKKNITTVIHCAAYSYVIDGEINKTKYNNNNVKQTKKFINICKKNSVQNFIFLSSSNVYRDGKSIFNEIDAKKPKNTYGKNKLEIENYLKKKKFNNLIILRLFNVVGLLKVFYIFKFNKNNYQRLFFRLVEKKRLPQLRYYKIKKKIIYPKRDFIDISDLVNLFLKIINKMKTQKINKIFNVGNGKATSINFISKLFKKYNKKLKFLNPSLITDKELASTKADVKLVKKYFNWKPVKTVKSSVLSTIKYSKF